MRHTTREADQAILGLLVLLGGFAGLVAAWAVMTWLVLGTG